MYEDDDPRYLNTKITQTIGLVQKDVKFTYDLATGENTIIERYLDGLLKVKTTNAYDVHGRLTGIEHRNSSNAVIANDIYVLDDLDRVRTQTLNGAPRTIGYDDTDQVVSVAGSNPEGYAYDLNGNRTNAGYVTVSGNRLMSDGTYSYDYDAEGNRLSRTKISDSSVELYTWDYRNRLKSIVSKTSMTGTVTRTVGYEYDVDDQRVRKSVTSATPSAGDGVENYYLDGNQIALVTDGGGNKTFHYLYGLNVDAVLAQDSPAGMVWALADRLGSVDTLTDSDGVVVNRRTFDSFGRVLSETNPLVQFRYGYTGRERDLESGLNYYRARHYDPQVGRFISVDPLGFGAGDTNLYRYVGNNSTNATDPSGEFAQAGALAIGGAIFGGLYALAKDIEDNKVGLDTFGHVLVGAVAGGVIGGAIGLGLGGLALAATNLTGSALAGAAVETTATAYFTAKGLESGIDNIFFKNRPLTGALDLIGAGLGGFGLFRSSGGGGGGSQCGAMALSPATAMASSLSLAGSGGAFAGQKADELFQHYLEATGETNETEIGKQVHKDQADIRRNSGEFSTVNSPITDKAGNDIIVPKKVDLKTGKPRVGAKTQKFETQKAVPDATIYDRGIIIDDKPTNRRISKDRQEIIRFIKAYEAREGELTKTIAIQRYDPTTGKPTVTELYKPEDFLPKK